MPGPPAPAPTRQQLRDSCSLPVPDDRHAARVAAGGPPYHRISAARAPDHGVAVARAPDHGIAVARAPDDRIAGSGGIRGNLGEVPRPSTVGAAALVAPDDVSRRVPHPP